MLFKKLMLSMVCLICTVFSQNKGTLQIEIKGLSNSEGFIQVDLYTSHAGFPSDNEYAFKTLRLKPDRKIIHIKELPYGVLCDCYLS